MATSVLRDQQYMFGVRSLLAAEKALLIRNDRPGRDVVATTNTTIAAVDAFVRSDRRVSISDIVRHTGISQDSVHRIVRNHLKFRKVSARWVPKQLKAEQQAMRMMTSLDNLQRYKTEGEAMLERIVTGDETWVHHYQPEAMETQRIADSDQVQGCALSEQSDGYRVLGHERSIAC